VVIPYVRGETAGGPEQTGLAMLQAVQHDGVEASFVVVPERCVAERTHEFGLQVSGTETPGVGFEEPDG
jgi:hypothetical protein